MTATGNSAFDQAIARIRNHEAAMRDSLGWSMRFVFPTASSPGVDFTYTIGLTEKFNAPELVIFGVGQSGGGILTKAVQKLEAGHRFSDWEVDREIIRGFSLCFRSVTVESASGSLVAAHDLYGSAMRVMQIVSPDRRGAYPWEEGCIDAWRQTQLQLEFVTSSPPSGEGAPAMDGPAFDALKPAAGRA